MPHNFWMINCNDQNFDITRELGFTQQGLKAEYRRKVQRVEPGDRIIYYVSGDRVFTATATVTRGYEEVNATPWVKEGKTPWPYRIGIRPNVVLDREKYIAAGMIAYRLEYLRKWPPEDWHLAFQGNLHLLSKNDFALLETEMMKLRYGRDEALQRVDEELAAETERLNAHKERRRRSTDRDTSRPARQRNVRDLRNPASEPARKNPSRSLRRQSRRRSDPTGEAAPDPETSGPAGGTAPAPRPMALSNSTTVSPRGFPPGLGGFPPPRPRRFP